MIDVNTKLAPRSVTFRPWFYRSAAKRYKNGDHRDFIALMKESRKDALVAGALNGRKAGYLQDIQVRPFEDSDQDANRAQALQRVINNLKPRKLMKAFHEAQLYFYVVVDYDWDIVDGLQVPVGFEKFDQRHFIFDDDNHKFTAETLRIDFGREKREIEPTASVLVNDELPVMWPVVMSYILKDHGLESWASLIENFGEPFIISRYPPGITDTEKAEIDKELTKIAQSTRGRMRNDSELDLVERSGSDSPHKDFTESAEKAISIAILGHANAVQDSNGMTVGQNQMPFQVAQNIAGDDVYFQQEAFNELIKTIYRRNWADRRFPSAVLRKPDSTPMKERRENIRLAFDIGAEVQPDDLRKLGLTITEDQGSLQKNDPVTFTQ